MKKAHEFTYMRSKPDEYEIGSYELVLGKTIKLILKRQ